jgi:glutamate decarboxylase
VQVSREKFAPYFDVELREAPMTRESYTLTPEQVLARTYENTIAVVVTLGQTFTGLYEDVVAISRTLDELEARTGLSVPIHVDAASGGFLAPFVTPELVWDFRLPRVRSINASGHKMGLTPLGCGWALWREAADLPAELVFNVNYLGGDYPTFNLNFSRPGGPVIAQYYEFLRLGREGYEKIHSACYETGARIAAAVAAVPGFSVVHAADRSRGIPAVTWQLDDGAARGFNLFDVSDRLRAHGWLAPAYTLPADLQDSAVQRVLVRHGLSSDLGAHFIADFRRALETLERHPPSASMTEPEVGGFTHDARPAQ